MILLLFPAGVRYQVTDFEFPHSQGCNQIGNGCQDLRGMMGSVRVYTLGVTASIELLILIDNWIKGVTRWMS